MAVDPNKIYELKLIITGSDVDSNDILEVQLSGSFSSSFFDTTLSGSVTSWQTGQEISGSTLISEYETATAGSGLTVTAVRFKNFDGVCTGEVSDPFLFDEVVPSCTATVIGQFIAFDENDQAIACNNTPSLTLYSENGTFTLSTEFLYKDSECTPADDGFYSNDTIWLQVDSGGGLATGAVVDSGNCA